jgi:peptidoglycan/LPS O-acetylase OafA/YrhL
VAAVGPTAVSFFYVLSGAVMTWGCTGPDGRSARAPLTFWVQRGSRILPAYYTALAISLPTFVAAVKRAHPHGGVPGWSAATFAACVLLLQAFIPPLAEGLNTPGWSISCEGFFYASWPRLVGWLRRSRPGLPWREGLWLCGLGYVAPLIARQVIRAGVLPSGPFPSVLGDVTGDELLVRFVSYFPLLRASEFALGIVLGHALRNTPSRARSVGADTLREALLLAALAGGAWILGAPATGDASDVLAHRVLVESGTLAPLFALLVWQLARGRGWVQRALGLRWLLVLGEASYALYILQEPVYVWLTAVLKRVWPVAMTRPDRLFWVYFALLVGASIATQHLIEQPLRKIVNAGLQRRLRAGSAGM